MVFKFIKPEVCVRTGKFVFKLYASLSAGTSMAEAVSKERRQNNSVKGRRRQDAAFGYAEMYFIK
jgi:hypothetical protein